MRQPGGLAWVGIGLPAEEEALSGSSEPCLICLEKWPKQQVPLCPVGWPWGLESPHWPVLP